MSAQGQELHPRPTALDASLHGEQGTTACGGVERRMARVSRGRHHGTGWLLYGRRSWALDTVFSEDTSAVHIRRAMAYEVVAYAGAHMDSKRTYMPQALLFFCIAAGSLTILSLVAGLLEYSGIRANGGLGILWLPDRNWDFYDYETRLTFVHTRTFFALPGYHWYYPAAGIVPYEFFHQISLFIGANNSHKVFVALSVLVVGVALALFAKQLVRAGLSQLLTGAFLLITLLTAWPIYFSNQRGNFESILWVLLGASVWAIADGQPGVGATLLGAVGAVKLYPLLCLGLFLKGRRWKSIVLAIVVAFTLTLASLRFLEPSVSYAARQVADGMRAWTADYALAGWRDQMGYDHSLFELCKAISSPLRMSEQSLLSLYLPIAGLWVVSLYFFRVRRLPLANQALYLIGLAVLLPPASFDYTLQNLYIPFAWISVLILYRPRRPIDVVIMTLFAIALAPLTFLYIGGIYIAGAVKALAILSLVGIAAMVPLLLPSEQRVRGDLRA